MMGSTLLAQQNAIEKYFTDHLENPAFSKFEITGKSFELIGDIETNDTDEQRVLDALANISGVLWLKNENTPIGQEYYEEATKELLEDGDYEDLIVFENEDNRGRFMIKEDESGIQEFVGIMGNNKFFQIASLYGDIDVASLSRILEVMRNGKGKWVEHLGNMHNEEIVITQDKNVESANARLTNVNLDDLRLSIYPNPATEFINIESVNGKSTQLKVGIYTLNGKEILEIGSVNLPHKLSLENLPSGTYFLRLTDDSGTYKNFKVVKPTE